MNHSRASTGGFQTRSRGATTTTAAPTSATAARAPRRPPTANTVKSAAAATRMSPFVWRNSRTIRATSDQPHGRQALLRCPAALTRQRAQKQQEEPARGVAAEGVVIQRHVCALATAHADGGRRAGPRTPRLDQHQIDRDDRREGQQQRQDARREELGLPSNTHKVDRVPGPGATNSRKSSYIFIPFQSCHAALSV